MSKQILTNVVYCHKCKTTIESKSMTLVTCLCKNVSIYGGKEYAGRFVHNTRILYDELSTYLEA